jgi:hypothetical protein
MSKEMVGNCIKHKSCLNMPFHTEKCETCGTGMKNFRELKLTNEDVKKIFDNNPSPLEAIDKIEIRIGSMSLQLGKEFKIIEQALTNYANMVEMLEEVKKQFKVKLSKSYIVREAVYRKTLIDCIADITKVLEGKNER